MQQSTQIGWVPVQALPPGLIAGVTTRVGGVSKGAYAAGNLAEHVGDDPHAVVRNRKALQQSLGAAQVQWLRQTHSTTIVYANPAAAQNTPSADAVWTDVPGLAVAVLTADCVPVLLWRADGSAVAAVHAGWRGLVGGIIQGAVAQLTTTQSPVHAWIGPCIRPRHYEVGADVWQQFVSWPADVVLDHPSDAAKRLLDLGRAAQHCLQACGVLQIEDSGLCTYCDGRFYSFRGREHQHKGRFASVIMMS